MSGTALRRVLPAFGAALSAALLTVVAGTASAAGTFTAIVLPDDGHSAVYNFIGSATKTLSMTMYELNDTTAEQDLVAAAQRGVTVRVILDGKHSSVNGPAYRYLNQHGVPTKYSSSLYYYTHEKALVADGSSTLVLSGNLDSTYYGSDRDYGVIDTDPVDAAAVQAVFNADYAGTSITPNDGDHLVWSPTDSQTQLLNLINGAQSSLLVEELEFGDTTLVNAIVSAAKRGVQVHVVSMNESSYASNFTAVKSAGGSVVTYSTTTGLYIHAKAIVADYGLSTAKVFVGSENFSDTSLNSNRELGLILTDTGVLNRVDGTASADFSNGTPW